MDIEFDSVEAYVPLRNKIKEDMTKNGYFYFESEGISQNDRGDFSIFDRFIIKNSIEKIERDEIKNNIEKLLSKKIEYFRYLKNKIGMNVFFIVFKEDCSMFWIWELNDGEIKFLTEFDECSDLSNWLRKYITLRETIKPFKKPYLRCIDNYLRKYGTPYPGNFDGIIFSFKDFRPKLVLEFSKVEYITLDKHKKNLYGKLGKKFFREDINRWKIFFGLSQKLQVPNVIIWWYTKKEEYMLGRLDHLKSEDGIKITTDTIDYNYLINYLLDVIRNV